MQTVLEQPTPSSNKADGAGLGQPENTVSHSQPDQIRQAWKHWLVLLAVWALSMAWMGARWNHGWVPHDDGMLAQSADRVMHGELPHRDFDEVYTGGLDYLHALGFKIFGEDLLSLRRVLFLFFALWVPVFYYCLTRFAGPITCGLATVMAVAWSFPNYPASMPSWYNLIFATFGVAALLRFIEVRKARWLFAAGICAGCSFLIKIAGLYFVGAVCIFLLFCEQTRSLPAAGKPRPARRNDLYRIALNASVFGLILGLIFLVRRLLNVSELYFFIVPVAALGLLLIHRAAQPTTDTDLMRFKHVFRLLLPFCAGVLIPVAIFLLPFAATRSLAAFFNGVFVIPFIRITKAKRLPPGLGDFIALVPLLAILAFSLRSKFRESRYVMFGLALGFAAVLYFAPENIAVYKFAFIGLWLCVPLVVVAGAYVLAGSSTNWKSESAGGERLFLILCALAFCGLVQFPYSSPTYFCYVAPLMVLGGVALLAAHEPVPKSIPAALSVLYTLFMVLLVTPSFSLDGMSSYYVSPIPMIPLTAPRAAGLSVFVQDASEYNSTLDFVKEKANGRPIFAGPDCPEIYFLASAQNPTRMIFDFLEDYVTETTRVLAALDAHDIAVIVIDRQPRVSEPFSPELRAELRRRYPQVKDIGKFQVRWRD